MNVKRTSLLAALMLSLTLLAVPAASSAHVWTDDGKTLGEGEPATQGFEGIVTITIPKTLFSPHSTVVCPVTLPIEAEGFSAGRVIAYIDTTSLCEGTGTYAGCTVIEDTSSAAIDWGINVQTTPILIKNNAGGNLKLRYAFNLCGVAPLQLEFGSITVTPTLNGAGRITLFSLSGTATSGATISGGLAPEEGSTTLGLK